MSINSSIHFHKDNLFYKRWQTGVTWSADSSADGSAVARHGRWSTSTCDRPPDNCRRRRSHISWQCQPRRQAATTNHGKVLNALDDIRGSNKGGGCTFQGYAPIMKKYEWRKRKKTSYHEFRDTLNYVKSLISQGFYWLIYTYILLHSMPLFW